jgi:hypothetical protein
MEYFTKINPSFQGMAFQSSSFGTRAYDGTCEEGTSRGTLDARGRGKRLKKAIEKKKRNPLTAFEIGT